MQFSTIIIAFAGLIAASPIAVEETNALVERQSGAPGASNVVQDTKLAGQDLVRMNNTCNSEAVGTAYTGDQVSSFISINQQILYDINNCTESANATSSYNSADSSSIASVQKALLPTASSVLKNMQAHYDSFNATGIVGPVHDSLVNQQEAAREMLNALQSRLASPYNTQIPAASKTLMGYFSTAIAAFDN